LKIAEEIIYRYLAKRRRLPDKRLGYTQRPASALLFHYDPTFARHTRMHRGWIFIDMPRNGAASGA